MAYALPSRSLAASRRLRTVPSNTWSPTRATAPPITSGSTMTLSSTCLPVARASTSASRRRRRPRPRRPRAAPPRTRRGRGRAPASVRAPVPAARHLVDVVLDQLLVPAAVELLADDAAGELHGDLRHLGPELLEHAVALGADLLLRADEDLLRLLLGLRHQVAPELVRGLSRLLDDLVGVLAGRRELFAVLDEDLVGLFVGLICPLELTLDLLAPLFEHRVHPGQDPFPREEEEHREGERADDELLPVRIEVGLVVDVLGGDQRKCVHVGSPLDDERERDAEEGQRLDQADTDEHRRS